MIIGSGANRYKWIDNWAKIPDTQSASEGWAHHGMAVTEAGEIIGFHQGDATVLVFDTDGEIIKSWTIPVREAHQMALAYQGTKTYLWVADPGNKNVKVNGKYASAQGEWGGQVLRMTLGGQIDTRITTPEHEAYEAGKFAPTSVAVYQSTRGGNDDIWISDGYGESYVHRYTASGEYIRSISGEEGDAGRFACPHGVWIDYRKSEPELLIADRTNRRVQVYDLEGKYKRHFGSDVLNSPSGFAIDGDQLIVAELRARLAVFDRDDVFVCYIGENERIARVERNSREDVPGWPNNLDSNGHVIRPTILEAGKFNSPHGLAADSDGNLYVGEWLVGGRYTKLVKQQS